MSDKPEKPAKGEKSTWTGKAALAGAAIGSAALAAALLYASRRKEEAERKRHNRRLDDALDTD